MAITLVGQVDGGDNEDNVVLSLPGGVQEDDMVVAFGGHFENTGTADAGAATPGYQTVVEIETVNGGYWVGWKAMGSTPDTEFEGKNNGPGGNSPGAYGLYVFRGVDTATPMDASPVNTGEEPRNGNGNPDPPEITTVTDAAWVLAIGMLSKSNKNFFGIPSGYSNELWHRQTDQDRYQVAAGTKEIATAGAEDPGEFAWATDTVGVQIGITVALRPAAAGGGGTFIPRRHRSITRMHHETKIHRPTCEETYEINRHLRRAA